MKLNCDLGEGFSIYTLADESLIVPLIDQANIACGFHGGDAPTILSSLNLCAKYNTEIGAHPSYPDLQGFGRRSMQMATNELAAIIMYQISAITGLAKAAGSKVTYVKPHGALYNDMMKDKALFRCVIDAVQRIDSKLSVMVLATPNYEDYVELAGNAGISLQFEAFADRRYTDDGLLTPRGLQGAVLTERDAVAQAQRFIEGHAPFPVDSLCVHGDTPAALHMVREIRALLHG